MQGISFGLAVRFLAQTAMAKEKSNPSIKFVGVSDLITSRQCSSWGDVKSTKQAPARQEPNAQPFRRATKSNVDRTIANKLRVYSQRLVPFQSLHPNSEQMPGEPDPYGRSNPGLPRSRTPQQNHE